MRTHFMKGCCWLILFMAALCVGCSGGSKGGPVETDGTAKEQAAKPTAQTGKTTANQAAQQARTGKTTAQQGRQIQYTVSPETFSLTFQTEDKEISVSLPGKSRRVEDFQEQDGAASWTYPEEEISVSMKQEADYIQVTIQSDTGEDNGFTWPLIGGDSYYLPLGEGKRIPAGDPVWKEYLDRQSLTVMEALSMPYWSATYGAHGVIFIMEDPLRTNMVFAGEPDLSFSVEHSYPAIDPDRTSSYRIYLTENDPVVISRIYKDYVTAKGEFVPLEQKAEGNADIRKLYGAPHIYLHGEFILSPDDVDWPAFREELGHPVMEYIQSFFTKTENGTEVQSVFREIAGQDYVAEYQKNSICSYITAILKRDDFYRAEVFTQSSEEMEGLLERGYGNLNPSERIQINKHALAVNLPEVFHPAGTWMDGETLDVLKGLREAGIDRAWIGLNSWEQAYQKPELAEQAVNQGYLLAAYDSYHSIHEPGKEQWITAKFPDKDLYEQDTISDQTGKKLQGFKNVGRKLNPTLSLPAVRERMEGIMNTGIPFNSWFVDCDAFGEIFDDYTPGHVTTQQEDLAARMERMAYIRDIYGLVMGSEGGNDFAASTLAFAHGIELKSFSWMDADMNQNKDSQYYIGKYYNPNGGVPEHFSKRVPLKEMYYAIFLDPSYDVPLYKLVYNDSVITSYHWDWSTFKVQGATEDRMIREVLYNVAPLYHLDGREWERYGEDISRHVKVWSEFSRKAVLQAMTGFEYLTEDGLAQETRYGEELLAVANYGDTPFEYESRTIPAHSVLIRMDGVDSVYTPQFSPSELLRNNS